MEELAKKARNEYIKQWRSKPENRDKQKKYMSEWRSRPENKQKIKQYQDNYWAKKAQQVEEARI